MKDALTVRDRAADIVDGVEMVGCECLATTLGVEVSAEAAGGKGLETGWTLFGPRWMVRRRVTRR